MADSINSANKATIGAQVVTQTLDTLNSGMYSGKGGNSTNKISQSYDFQKKVLSAVYEGKGTIADSKS